MCSSGSWRRFVDAPTVRLDEFLEDWLTGTVAVTVREGTRRKYEQRIRLYINPHLGHHKLGALTPQMFQRWIGEPVAEGFAPGTVNGIRATLNAALSRAVDWGMLQRNPVRATSVVREPPNVDPPLQPEQARQLLAQLRGDSWEPLIYLALTTGLRQGELLALRWRDVDLEAGRLTVARTVNTRKGQPIFTEPKTRRSRRTILIPGRGVELLIEHRALQDDASSDCSGGQIGGQTSDEGQRVQS